MIGTVPALILGFIFALLVLFFPPLAIVFAFIVIIIILVK